MATKNYVKPATKKHASMDVVQGSSLYYTSLYYTSLYYYHSTYYH